MSKSEFEIVAADHPVSALVNTLVANASHIGTTFGLSHWEVCVAMANACGKIIASHPDMPRDVALERLEDLRQCAQASYDLFDARGEG